MPNLKNKNLKNPICTNKLKVINIMIKYLMQLKQNIEDNLARQGHYKHKKPKLICLTKSNSSQQ